MMIVHWQGPGLLVLWSKTVGSLVNRLWSLPERLLKETLGYTWFD